LESYGILHTSAEQAFDDITKLAAQICAMPVALVNLVARDHQWAKSEVGVGRRRMSLEESVCRHLIVQQDDVLLVPDLTKDARFTDNPIVVNAPYARSYAGVALRTPDGQTLGALCVLDLVPRELTDAQLTALRALARQVMSQLELRKLAAKQGQQSREFDAVLSNVRDIIYIFDRDGRFKYANKTLLDLFGMSREELQAKSLPELGYSPATIDYLLAQINEVYSTKQRTTGEISHVTPTGVHGVYEHLFAPLLNEDGSVQAVVGSTRDVTGHKAAQAQLRENADRLSLALSAANLGDWDWDAESDLMKLSPRAAEIYGVPVDPPLTRTAMRAFLHEDSRERSKMESDRAAGAHGDYDIEYRVNRPAGGQVWVAAKGRGVYDANGKLSRMIGVVQDITARKTLEQEREQLLVKVASERARLTDAFMRSPAFMCLLSGPDHVFEFANEQYFKLINRNDIVGKTVRQALPELAGQGYFELLDHVYGTGDAHVGKDANVFVTRGDGSGATELHHVDFVYQPVTDANGAVTGIFVHGIDMTDSRRIEQEREQLLASERSARSEAERASHMKDEFLATLSHELRTPLNAIYGWSQILRTGTCDADEMASGLETIERNARVQTQIIEDLLDMSRIISGKIRLDVRRIDVATVVKAAIETVRPAADAKGIRLHAMFDTGAGNVMGDPNRLQQVFWNLLSNAIKFTPKAGRVTICSQRVDSQLEVNVTDTGEGIRPDFLPHVFDRFRQSDASTTRRHGGLGLGLAIVKQLVELHGGSARVRSEGLGHGTTFTVALPPTILKSDLTESPTDDGEARRTTASTAIVTAECAATLAGKRVLVVDDEPDARALVQRLLEDCDAIVLTASSAAEALRMVVEHRPDILVSDIGMPGEDGFALIRSVRALGPERGGNILAIALTAYARREDRVRVMMAGFQMHIAKPVEPAELFASLASLVTSAGR